MCVDIGQKPFSLARGGEKPREGRSGKGLDGSLAMVVFPGRTSMEIVELWGKRVGSHVTLYVCFTTRIWPSFGRQKGEVSSSGFSWSPLVHCNSFGVVESQTLLVAAALELDVAAAVPLAVPVLAAAVSLVSEVAAAAEDAVPLALAEAFAAPDDGAAVAEAEDGDGVLSALYQNGLAITADVRASSQTAEN